MRGEQRIRSQMAFADPARAVPVPPTAVPATHLIARAEVGEAAPVRRRPVLARRPLLVGAAAAAVVAAVAAYALVQPEPDPGRPGQATPDWSTERALGSVVEPIAFEVTTDAPPAGDYLRDLAARITDAPYDGRTGVHAHHLIQVWGAAHYGSTGCATGAGSPALCWVSEVNETETWARADGWRRHRFEAVGLEYPDEDSRRHFEAHPDELPMELPPSIVDDQLERTPDPVPTDRAQLTELMGLDDGVPDFWRIDAELFSRWLVPREVRAEVLEILADVPGIVWRGQVTDRAGRTGVAISHDSTRFGIEYRDVLVFDPVTGELLSREAILLQPAHPTVDLYMLYLEVGWTDDPGPEPTVVDPVPSPTEPGTSTPPDPSPTP